MNEVLLVQQKRSTQSGLRWLALLPPEWLWTLEVEADMSEVKSESPGALGNEVFTSSVNGQNQSRIDKKWARYTLDILPS